MEDRKYDEEWWKIILSDTPEQIIAFVQEHPDCTPKQICRGLGRPTSTVGHHIVRMIDDGTLVVTGYINKRARMLRVHG